MRIVYDSRLFKFWPLKHYSAIVLGRTMLTRFTAEALPAEVLVHEAIHQEQMDRHGILGFYALYLWHYLKNLYAYRNHWAAYYNIPFEQEAYARSASQPPRAEKKRE